MDWFIIILFLAAFGGCVGSFLNVVAYRLPEGKSLHWPPSQCPKCETRLHWYENIPVFAWIWLRGKCRTCGKPISVQYPVVEAICALLFVGLFFAYYSESAGPALGSPYEYWGFRATWAVYVVHLVLIAGLLVSTIIDARLYIIPLEIPWLVTAIAFIALPIYGHFEPDPVLGSKVVDGMLEIRPVVPVVNAWGVSMALGGLAGLGLSLLLLHFHILPRSFDDEEAHQLDAVAQIEQQTDDAMAEAAANHPPPEAPSEAPPEAPPQASAPEVNPELGHPIEPDAPMPPTQEMTATEKAEMFLTYSHARREVLKEALFVALPIAGFILGAMFMPDLFQPNDADKPVWLMVLGGVATGYLAGGAIVWITRILGTLGFGREAMGLGDVHLLGAIGAVLGPDAAIATFFVAPFLGLAYVVIAIGVSKAFKTRQVKIIPYGPYLAAAAVLVMIAREPIISLFIR